MSRDRWPDRMESHGPRLRLPYDQYGKQLKEPLQPMLRGWAAVLELYGLR